MFGSDGFSKPFVPTKHWGEIQEATPVPHPIPPILTEDIKRSMRLDCLDEYDTDENVMQITQINLPPMDPLVMYAIDLHKWMNNMLDTINLAEIATEGNVTLAPDAKIPIPEMPEIHFRHKQNLLNFLPAKSPGKEKEPELNVPELSEAIVKQILTKCVAVMTAQIGFEDSFQSVLDILVDLLDQFLIKICGRFVSALTEEENLGTSGFPNVAERVLVELGLGGVKSLHNYYQYRVIKYVSMLQKRCKEMEQYYTSMVVPRPMSPMGEIGKYYTGMVQVKEEREDESDVEMVDGEQLISSNTELLDILEPETEYQSYQ